MTSGKRPKSTRVGATLPDELEHPQIDFLILADRAEGINGKLYMMGGGWNEIRVPDLGQPVGMSLAIGVLVPWNRTNESHTLTIWVEHEDGTKLEPEISAQLNVGRPPEATPGQSFRAIIAVNGPWKFPQYSSYVAVAVVGGSARKTAAFRVLRAHGVALPFPPS